MPTKRALYQREWRKRNPESSRRSQLKYARSHKEKISIYLKDYQKRKVYKDYQAKWNRENKATLRARQYAWQKANKDYIIRWNKENIEKMREWRRNYEKNQRATNPEYVAKKRCRGRITAALKLAGVRRFSRTRVLLGCSFSDLRRHIESRFLPGMNWENRAMWHIDHIKPCARFDLTDPEQQKACFHYTNLQPLWQKDNQSKGDKWEESYVR